MVMVNSIENIQVAHNYYCPKHIKAEKLSFIEEKYIVVSSEMIKIQTQIYLVCQTL